MDANKMNQTELAAAIAKDTGVTQADVKKVLSSLVSTVEGAIAAGGSVSMSGFVTFERVERAAREGRNPATGEAMTIPAGTSVKVTPGSRLKKAGKGN